MSEVAGLTVRGPVRTCRHESAEWDRDRETWRPSDYLTIVTFRPDGQVSEGEHHNPDGSIARWAHAYDDAGRLVEGQSWTGDGPRSRVLHAYDQAGRRTGSVHVAPDGTRQDAEICSYDGSGRKTRLCFLPDPGPHIAVGFGIEGSEVAHGAPGAATMTVTFDVRDLPAEGIFRDASHAVVRHIVHTRDNDGRLVSEAVYFAGDTPFTDLQPGGADIPPEERAKMATLVAQLFADRTFASVTYEYDEKGRVAERTMRMGSLSEDRTTFTYNDRDDPIDEVSEHHSRSAGFDDDGIVRTTEEAPRTQHTRFDYRYDDLGNWTEQIVWSRIDESSDFQRSNVIRRTITYYL